jgi:hypothetical protein
MAEDAARELPNLPLEDALQLVHLYAERGSPKFEPAARRWLVRYLSEGTPNLRDVAKVTASLASSSGGNTKVKVVQLAGVPIRNADVLVLVDRLHTAEMHRTAEALEVALGSSKQAIVALSVANREQILWALDDPPTAALAELRGVLLTEHEWRVREGLV